MLPARLRTALSAPLAELGTLRARPHVLLYSLGTAVLPWSLLVGTAILLVFAMPPLRDALLDRFFPQESFIEKVGSIFQADSRDARRANAAHWITLLSWWMGSACALLCFWSDLPNGIARAARRSHQKEKLADQIARRSANASLKLYRVALRLAVEPERIEALEKRVHSLRPIAPDHQGEGIIAGRYELLDVVARGANGVVHRAKDLTLDRTIALKQLAATVASEEDRARFRQEARALAQLRHANIVQVYDLFEHEAGMWIAMEFVEGGDLAQKIQERGRIEVDEAIRLAHAIADAMEFAHGQGIIHRDLKALNVLLSESGEARIADFGTAKLSSSTVQTVGGTIMGSPHSMSPEQVRGEEADARSDVYSLGIVIYQMLLGRPPFGGEMMAVLNHHLQTPPPVVDQQEDSPPMPPELARLIMSMLAKEPAERPSSMAAIREALSMIATTAEPAAV